MCSTPCQMWPSLLTSYRFRRISRGKQKLIAVLRDLYYCRCLHFRLVYGITRHKLGVVGSRTSVFSRLYSSGLSLLPSYSAKSAPTAAFIRV